MLFLIAATALLVLAVPGQAHAWGGGVHLQIGMKVLANLDAIAPSIAAIIGARPFDFLYGCIAADITLGKKYTHYLQHCHRWRIGFRILEKAGTDAQKACAYGYLSHLAADCVAHNYYVPFNVMKSFSSITLKHAYWEMRFENYVEKEIWETAKKVAQEHYHENDLMLQKVVSNTLFSFATNKRIFNSILLVSRLEQWHSLLDTLAANSRYSIEDSEREEYLQLSEEAVFGFLNLERKSHIYLADPTGEHALAAGETVRKNLKLLYKAGKLTKPQALAELEELKLTLKDAICEPLQLKQIVSK